MNQTAPPAFVALIQLNRLLKHVLEGYLRLPTFG